jgi:signal transduction histidine kinase
MANAMRFAEVERYARGWRLLSQVGRRVVESLNQRAVLHALVDGARSLLGTDVAFLALMTPGGKSLQVVASTGLHTRAMRRLMLGLDQGIAGAVLIARGPLLVDDYLSDPRLKGSALKEVTAEGLVSLLAVPFGTKGRPEGVLYVANRHRTPFTSQQAQLLEAMANLADLAIAHGRAHGRGRRRLRVMEARQRHLQAVIEAIPAGVIIVEAPSGRVTMVNGAAAHILAPDGGPTPRNVFDFALYRSDGTPLPRPEGPRARALAGQPSTGMELLVERRDGSRLPVLVNAASLQDERGAVAEVVLVLEDISQVKKLDQLKDEFLSMVSHDLRTPLTTMKTVTESLAFDVEVDEEAQRRQAEALNEEIDRMAALVTNLLDMSRIRAGAMTPEPEECHILDIAQDALRELEMARMTRDHRIATDISPQLPLVYADPHQLQRVLVNLLSNAVKYSAHGTSVTVAASVAHDHGELVISVQDQGVGIPPEELPHIFEKFYRRTGRDRRGHKGTGLGLAICKALVELNGGRIWAESTPGQGSTFFFAIPTARGTANAGSTGRT